MDEPPLDRHTVDDIIRFLMTIDARLERLMSYFEEDEEEDEDDDEVDT
jgi:hypothetical protein